MGWWRSSRDFFFTALSLVEANREIFKGRRNFKGVERGGPKIRKRWWRLEKYPDQGAHVYGEAAG